MEFFIKNKTEKDCVEGKSSLPLWQIGDHLCVTTCMRKAPASNSGSALGLRNVDYDKQLATVIEATDF